jgi:hypothetical protein
MSAKIIESHALSASTGKANIEAPLEPWDSAELLKSIHTPLVLEFSPLRSVLSSLHDRIELMAAHQNKMLTTLGDLSERVTVLAAAEQAKPTIDEETVRTDQTLTSTRIPTILPLTGSVKAKSHMPLTHVDAI